jgi:cobalt-zinc-cadmium efflux system outer membrane protein
MKRSRLSAPGFGATSCLAIAALLLGGLPVLAGPDSPPVALPETLPTLKVRPAAKAAPALPALKLPPAAARPAPLPVTPADDRVELSLKALVAQVLASNPSLAQMTAAFAAASARYPQVTSLEDPMFAFTTGPESFHPDDAGVEYAYRLEISQKIPWPGKLRLRGEQANAEARAAAGDVDSVRLQLIERTKDAYYEYFLTVRALDVNAEGLRLLDEFHENAKARYRTGSPQQDVLQAEVEIGREQKRRLALERMRQVAIARINTLLSQRPDRPLPPPPRLLAIREELPPAEQLRADALARRPDLQALASRIQAEEAALGLAYKEYYPDVEPFLMYDRFMGNVPDNRDLATMVGVRLNLPVYRARREGLVSEAQARLAQRRAELQRQINDVNFEVQQAYAQVLEGARAVRLFEQKILPAAQLNIKSAQSYYMNGKLPFLSLIEAQRNLVELRDQYYETLAEHLRRLAALERAVGGPVGPNSPRPPVPTKNGTRAGRPRPEL